MIKFRSLFIDSGRAVIVRKWVNRDYSNDKRFIMKIGAINMYSTNKSVSITHSDKNDDKFDL